MLETLMCPLRPVCDCVSVLGFLFYIVLFLSVYVEQERGQIPPAEAGPSWGGQAELSANPACLQARQLKGRCLM